MYGFPSITRLAETVHNRLMGQVANQRLRVEVQSLVDQIRRVEGYEREIEERPI